MKLDSKRKKAAKVLSIILCICLLAGIFTGQRAEASADDASAISDIYSSILKSDADPGADSTWHVLGITRSEEGSRQSYCNAYYDNVTDELLSEDSTIGSSYSDYAKIIIGLTACGFDASATDAGNLLKYLSDFNKVSAQGINGVAYALIAVNAHPSYSIPKLPVIEASGDASGDVDASGDASGDAFESLQNSEARMIDYILSSVITTDKGSGWALFGKVPDVDITAIVLTSLSPYYDSDSRVQKAVDNAIKWLSNAQEDDGGYYCLSAGSSVENCESVSQVVVALCALGIDPDTDSRFIKNGNSAYSALLGFYNGEGDFCHTESADAGGLATTEGFYALVAYNRFITGKTALFNMSDVEIVAMADEADEMALADHAGKDSGSKNSKNKSSKSTVPMYALVLYYAVGISVILAGIVLISTWLKSRKKNKEDGKNKK